MKEGVKIICGIICLIMVTVYVEEESNGLDFLCLKCYFNFRKHWGAETGAGGRGDGGGAGALRVFFLVCSTFLFGFCLFKF